MRSTESLIVADYRGLTNAQLVELRAKLRASGAQLKVVKNTLTRRAAEEAGTDSLLVLLEGPTAIAFVETDGDPVAVAKALADTAKETKVLELRGGLLSGRTMTGADVEELAKLPAPDIVKSQLVGAIVAPLSQLAAILAAPLHDLVGLIDARIEQLGGDSADAESRENQASASAEESAVDEPAADATASEETLAPADPADSALAEPAAEATDVGDSEPDHLADSAPAESAGTEEE